MLGTSRDELCIRLKGKGTDYGSERDANEIIEFCREDSEPWSFGLTQYRLEDLSIHHAPEGFEQEMHALKEENDRLKGVEAEFEALKKKVRTEECAQALYGKLIEEGRVRAEAAYKDALKDSGEDEAR